VVRASRLRPPGPGGVVTREPGGSWLAGAAVRQLAANRGHVLVELGSGSQVTGRDAVQGCLPDFVRQPEGDGRQRDRKVRS
jgi:hypothetical protein